MSATPPDVTTLLRQWQAGARGATEQLEPLVNAELHRLARHALRAERRGHTLQATDLVHDAFLRLFGSGLELQDRRHFYVLAARTMRRVLVDHARARHREKRGGGEVGVTLDEALVVSPERPEPLLALDHALGKLAELDPRLERVVELHYFAGLTYDETAQALGVSPATIKRDLRSAKAWLRTELEGG